MASTLAQLRTAVARDLRDPSMQTFVAAVITDLINAGIEEVSRIYPREVVEELTPVASTYEYSTVCETAFRVEVWRSGKFHVLLTPNEGETSQTGWDLWAGKLRLSAPMVDQASVATDTYRVWGYAPYAQLTADGDVSDLDTRGEWAVRHFARAQAFTLMHNDRAMFKQWQGQSQNTDVTSNQLNQMVSLYNSEWDRTRNYLRRLRRV